MVRSPAELLTTAVACASALEGVQPTVAVISIPVEASIILASDFGIALDRRLYHTPSSSSSLMAEAIVSSSLSLEVFISSLSMLSSLSAMLSSC